MSVWTKEEEINALFMERPHVVLLGAGASYAACPDGDKNGKKLPLMRNFVEICGLEKLLKDYDIYEPYDDFEAIYSDIANQPSLKGLKNKIEYAIREYFSSLELPDYPTLYDHLILSLRPKDVIATFNWDPFLSQAVVRNLQFIKNPPKIFFLHGNVTYRYCPNCKVSLPLQTFCVKCGKKLESSPLLYPVKEKNYQSNPAIKAQWDAFRYYLKSAWVLTIFGYSAPKTDVEAVQLMKGAWGNVENRNLEQIELIDIKDEEELIKTWSPFIHSHHYNICKSFYESYIAQFPRRSGEALWVQFIECKFLEPAEFPRNASFQELYEYLKPKIERENSEQITPPDRYSADAS